MQKPEMFHQIVLKVGYLSIINFRYAMIQNHILNHQKYIMLRKIGYNLSINVTTDIYKYISKNIAW